MTDGHLRRVTDELWGEYEPTWDPAGKYLYYLSDRDLAPQLFTDFEWNFAGNRTTGVYALALRQDVPRPLPPESDEVALDDEPKDGEEKQDDDKADEQGADDKEEADNGNAEAEKAPAPVLIDFEA